VRSVFAFIVLALVGVGIGRAQSVAWLPRGSTPSTARSLPSAGDDGLQPGCTYAFYGARANGFAIGRNGGTIWFELLTPSQCQWPVFTDSTFVAVRTFEANDKLTVYIDVAPNPLESPRWAWVYVADQWLPVTQSGTAPIVLPLDVNRDRHLDLLWQHQTDGRLAVWLMNGITQIAATPLTPAQVLDTSWKVVGTGDLDGDGSADVVWQNYADGRVAAWLMTGTVVREASLLSIPDVADLGWRIVTVGDFTGDGRADIIWQNEDRLAAWVMDGLSVLFAAELRVWLPEGRLNVVGNGDFDADGDLDLVMQSATGTGTWIVYMNGLFGDGWWWLTYDYPVEDQAWRIQGAADIDGNGTADLIWRNDNTGELAAWFMWTPGCCVLLRLSAELATPSRVEDLNWRIVGPR
jgi:VCBS repeat protein